MRAHFLLASLGLGVVCAATQPLPEPSLIEGRASCQGPSTGNPKVWWRVQIGHNGTTPYAADPTFQYYRSAVQYGADSSGKNDSSDAFNHAIDGK
jgi:glucan 1,3-beta-glucosidase